MKCRWIAIDGAVKRTFDAVDSFDFKEHVVEIFAYSIRPIGLEAAARALGATPVLAHPAPLQAIIHLAPGEAFCAE